MGVKEIMPDKGVKVLINGETHVFRFTMRSMAWLAEKYGSLAKSLAAFDTMAQGDAGLEQLTAMTDLIYAALIHENNGDTPEDIADSLDFGDAVALVPALMQAYVQAMGEGKKPAAGGKKNPPKA